MSSAFSACLTTDELVGRVVDDEVARQPDRRRLAPQQPRAERMERRQPDPVRILADERCHALAHLLGRFVRERHREHLIRLCMAVADDVGDAVRDDARLAGPRAGENEQGAFGVEHGLALFGVEFGEEVIGGKVEVYRSRYQGSGIRSGQCYSESLKPCTSSDRPSQSVEEWAQAIAKLSHPSESRSIDEAKPSRDFDLRFELSLRSEGDFEVIDIRPWTAPAVSFSDVCRNRERSAAHLG